MAVVKGYIRDAGLDKLLNNAFLGTGNKLNYVGTASNPIKLEWERAGVFNQNIRTTNSMETNNEILVKVPANTPLPNLNILLSDSGLPVGATFVLEGNGTSSAYDQAFLYTRITLRFPHASNDV